MARYVDGFVIPMPTKNLGDYRKIAQVAGKVWIEHGALAYHECAGDDLDQQFGTPFPRLAKTKPGETVVVAFIVFKSRAHRDRVNAKVMKDPRLICDPQRMPFDPKRMSYGGFTSLVDLQA
jgi:uncharacterized protein YbaA (DUF1428 family)